jgi:argininosuccinate lyase
MRRQVAAEYRGYRTPGIRLTEDPIPLGEIRGANFAEMAAAIHWFDKAHLVMLVEEGLVSVHAGCAMLSALTELEPDRVLSERVHVGGGTHSGENYLIRRLGEDTGGQLHLGRSSGDLAEVGLRVTMRMHLLRILVALVSLRQAILPLSHVHRRTVMPGYTHGQQAQPTTYGHWLSMWAQVMARDFERLSQLYDRVNMSPAGAAILTGTDFPLNRHRTSELMGFAAPLANTLDAIHSHDLQLEYISTLAVHAGSMARLADDVLLWATAEFGFVRVPDRYCSTSSIMMQKRNPQAPQATKAIAAMAAGAVTIAHMGFKGSTGLPIHERGYVEGQLWSCSDEVAKSLGWWTDLLPALTVNADRMAEMAGAHWAQATDLAGILVRERSMGWRTAHQIVGILCRLAEERHLSPAEATPELLDEAAVEYMGEPVMLSQVTITAALDARQFPARRTLYGGPAETALDRELAELHRQLEFDESSLSARRSGLDRATVLLTDAIKAICRSADTASSDAILP